MEYKFLKLFFVDVKKIMKKDFFRRELEDKEYIHIEAKDIKKILSDPEFLSIINS